MSGENQIIMLSSFCKSLLCTEYHFLIQCLFLDVFKVAVSLRVSCENAVSRQVLSFVKVEMDANSILEFSDKRERKVER